MSGTDLAFWALALIALVSGWRVFRTDSMVRASFLLLLSFVAVGLIMLLLGAPYLGTATVFMMTVEMTVMALFMVMFMMNPAGLNPMQMVHQHRFAIVAGALAFAGLALAILLSDFPHATVPPGRAVVDALGRELLGRSMLVFESVGVTLLATMVATVVLSARSGRFGPSDEGAMPPGLEPGGRPAGRVPEKTQGHGHGGMHGHGMHEHEMHGQDTQGHGMEGHNGHDQRMHGQDIQHHGMNGHDTPNRDLPDHEQHDHDRHGGHHA
jgi:NADH:ubiquinone oxidoreductase subunit 6 (subunit J)